MKFGKQIQSNQTPGWERFYLDYKGLKKIINSLLKGRPDDAALLAAGVRPLHHVGTNASPLPEQSTVQLDAPDHGSSLLQAHKAAFFFKLERELEKINTFYLQRESALKARLRTLIEKRKILQASLSDGRGSRKALKKGNSSFGALTEGFHNFEKDLSKLQAYVEINAEGFRKILKKFDKRAKQNLKELYLSRQVEVQPVFNRDYLRLASDVCSANLAELDGLLAGADDRRRAARDDKATADSTDDSALENMGRLVDATSGSDGFDALQDLEEALVAAVSNHDRKAIQNQLHELPMPTSPSQTERQSRARILWRAALSDRPEPGRPWEPMIATAELDFDYVDDISLRNPLHLATMVGHEPLVDVCLQRGVSSAQPDFYGRTPLHYAAINGFERLCDALLSASDVLPGSIDFDGFSPSLYSVLSGSRDVVAVFIDRGVDIEAAASGNDDLNALSLACESGHIDIARLLISKGAKLVANAAGYYPQHLAARQGHADMLRLLLDAERSSQQVDIIDKYYRWTPLFHAASEGHADCVQLLLACGADIAVQDEFSQTAVHYAAWRGHVDCVNLLLEAAARKQRKEAVAPAGQAQPGSTATASAASDPDEDGEIDMIPSLSLPPPIIPFRIFGHNYLDKHSLVQIYLGHPTTSSTPKVPPVRLYEQSTSNQQSSLKLVVSCPGETSTMPHTVMLPLADDMDSFAFQVTSLDELELNFDLSPTFGSKIIAKAAALPSSFASIKSQGAYIIPLLDQRLRVIGELAFEVSVVNPFEKAQLALGGHFETYWKSTNKVEQPRPDLPSPPTAPSVVTASSLSGDHVRVVVQITSDRHAVTYPDWFLPIEGVNVPVSQVTREQFNGISTRTGRGLSDSLPAHDSRTCYEVVARSMTTLRELLETLPSNLGVLLEVRYPTPSDAARLGIAHHLEVNDVVDRVLEIVYGAVDTKRRRVVFSSSNPNVSRALNWKQANFAVFLASHCGLSRSTPEGRIVAANRVETDRRCTSMRDAVKFAKNNNLLGVLLDSNLLSKVPSLIQAAKEEGLLVAALGPSSREVLSQGADAYLDAGVLCHPAGFTTSAA